MKPASQYGSEMWVMEEEGKLGIEAYEVGYLQSLLVSMKDKIRGIYIRNQLGGEIIHGGWDAKILKEMV